MKHRSMCEKTLKIKDVRIEQLETAIFEALKKEGAPIKKFSKTPTQFQSQRISLESNKENISVFGNLHAQNVRLEDFLRKKSPSNPITNNTCQKPLRPQSSNGTASMKVLMPSKIEFSDKLTAVSLSQRPGTSHSHTTVESIGSKAKLKSNTIFGDNLREMFGKKKNATSLMVFDKKPSVSLSKQLSIHNRKFECPTSGFKPESPKFGTSTIVSKSEVKRSEIENILFKLLEEHKETSRAPTTDNFLNKLSFIDKAIKR
jgi:hypothetical protein